MLLKYFYDQALAQASYMVGCRETGEALVIDPARDISPYLAAAQAENLIITQVTETHIHADFVSGSRELAAQTGARLYLSALGGYGFANPQTVLLRERARWMLGNVRVEVISTPGHTPEHLMFQVTDTKNASIPLGLFTGDCLFVGDVGRPDLLETALGISGATEQGARQQFANVERLKTMPDYLQIWPGHGAGSACGKALGELPSTTLGYEKRVNPAFQFKDEAAFVAWLLADQPETPPYFRQMKRVNQAGAALLASLDTPLPMEGFILAELLKSGSLVIDTRTDDAHVPGALHILPSDQFSTYAGWFINYDAPTHLIATPETIELLARELRAIGVDNLPGYFTPEELGDLDAHLATIRLREAAQGIEQGVLLLDVRGAQEFAEEHICGAINIPYGMLEQRLDELPPQRRVLLYCASGVRATIAASVLLKHGRGNFASIEGGLDAWKAAGLRVEQG
ncbi:MAG: MBL fold metallo-hydrolase [Chloroflexi bacterium]|nr:MBL fold metallo-hydrolase [Chloroflexota bacterium]